MTAVFFVLGFYVFIGFTMAVLDWIDDKNGPFPSRFSTGQQIVNVLGMSVLWLPVFLLRKMYQ